MEAADTVIWTTGSSDARQNHIPRPVGSTATGARRGRTRTARSSPTPLSLPATPATGVAVDLIDDLTDDTAIDDDADGDDVADDTVEAAPVSVKRRGGGRRRSGRDKKAAAARRVDVCRRAARRTSSISPRAAADDAGGERRPIVYGDSAYQAPTGHLLNHLAVNGIEPRFARPSRRGHSPAGCSPKDSFQINLADDTVT